MTFLRFKYYQLVLFLLLPLFMNGQQEFTTSHTINTDSLLSPLKTSNSIKLFDNYLLLSRFHQEKNLDSAAYYAKKALNYAVQENNNNNIAKAYHNKALLLLASDNEYASNKNIDLAKIYYYINKDSTDVALMNLDLGNRYYKKADLNQSLYHYLLGYDFFKIKEPSDKFAEAVGMIGRIYSDLGMIEESQKFQTLSLKVSENLHNPQMIMTSKNRMGLLLSKQTKYAEATTCFNKAIQIGMADESLMDELLIAFNGLANVHYNTGKYELSLYCSNKSLEILDVQKFPNEAACVYHTMGIAHLGLRNFSESENYLLKAHETLAKTPSNASVLSKCNEALYQLYEKIGNYKKALQHYQLFTNIKDSIYGQGVNERIAQLQSDRQLSKQNKAYNELQLKAENEKLRFDSKLKNLITIGAILIAALLCLFLYFFFKNKAIKSEAALRLAESKFHSLHAQMNPHFIFNVINGVQNYILKAEKYEAYNHLTTFANSIRLIIDNASKSFTSLEDELKLIKAYIDLEKVRFRNDFEYKINTYETLHISNLLIPTMIVQPLVENAILHGLSNKQGSGQLAINFNLMSCKQYIKCIIIDNGIGRAEAIKIKESKNQDVHLSIATINADQRIQMLKKMGYKQSEIKIVDLVDENQNPSGTEVTLCLPIKNQ